MKKKFITYDESIEIVNNLDVGTVAYERVFIADSLDRILACDIVANENSPAYATSGMDGYAIKYEDQKRSSIKIIDKNPAGSIVKSKVENGVCIKTFTGSLMPEGSDTLIPIENVKVKGDEIIVCEPVPKGFSVREAGENYKKDEVLIKKGTRIGFVEIGMMASLNIVQVNVAKKPVVAILSSGSEILDLCEEKQNESQFRSSNHFTLEAAAKKYGANAVQLGVVKDDKKSITKALKNALKCADIVVTTGGVSVGDYDFVKDVVKDELEAKILFHGVRIKPGQHILLAKKGEKYIVSLPGFAYSSTVTFLLYVVPLIAKLQGSVQKFDIVKAKILQDFKKKAPKTIFTACNLNYIDGEYIVDFKGKKEGTSAILTNMLGAALMIQDIKSGDLKSGDEVEVLIP